MKGNSMRYIAIIIALFIVIGLSISGYFWYENQSQINFIQQHPDLFDKEFIDSEYNIVYSSLLKKLKEDPEFINVLERNEYEITAGLGIVGNNNSALRAYEDEVRFPKSCEEKNVACSSIRTVLNAARENSTDSVKLAFTFWVEDAIGKSKGKPRVIDIFEQVFVACTYFNANYPFYGCQELFASTIENQLNEAPGESLENNIHRYAIARAIANYDYSYEDFTRVVNRFFNDSDLRNIILNEFDLLMAYVFLPENIKAFMDVNYAEYEKATIFVENYPWMLDYIIEQ